MAKKKISEEVSEKAEQDKKKVMSEIDERNLDKNIELYKDTKKTLTTLEEKVKELRDKIMPAVRSKGEIGNV